MIAVIIQARMGSTRMPGKTMKAILGKPLLYYSVARSALARYADRVIVATTEREQDNVIEEWCGKEGFSCYRGSEEDVLDRYYSCARWTGAHTVVRVTSDCPFIDPRILDLLILHQQASGEDYVVNRWKKRSWPHGLDAEVISLGALRRAAEEAKDPFEREHVTPYIMNHPEIFSILEVPYKTDLSHIRLTVDYPEDFAAARQLLEHLLPGYGIGFSWQNAVRELEEHPEIASLNRMYVDPSLR